MEESNSPDHLSSSLTDLMTSLMVIFILLLLVFVQRTGAKDPAAAARLLAELEKQLSQARRIARRSSRSRTESC
jgi:hypothetical protein